MNLMLKTLSTKAMHKCGHKTFKNGNWPNAGIANSQFKKKQKKTRKRPNVAYEIKETIVKHLLYFSSRKMTGTQSETRPFPLSTRSSKRCCRLSFNSLPSVWYGIAITTFHVCTWFLMVVQFSTSVTRPLICFLLSLFIQLKYTNRLT